MISYQFLESHGITIAAGKPMPLQIATAARIRMPSTGGQRPLHWGGEHVELMKAYRKRMIVMAAFGLTPPTGELHHEGQNNFKLELDLTDGLRSYYAETKHLLHDILERNGCTPLDVEFIDGEGRPREDLHFSTSHQVGSCRMADSPARGTCDGNGQVFGYPGMYVTDGAAIPGSLAVNTSLTILANAERIVEGIAARYGAGSQLLS
jgi:choline dehydrogenase-like flavoprotein